ncbi:MAG: tyrosine-type recombinase/integrase, partial [Synechococcus sp.]
QGWDWHTLRHSFATNLAETETPVNIARLTGHKSVNSVLRYAKRQDSQARAAIRRMNEAARVNSVDSDEQLTAKIIEIMAQLKSQGIA